MLNDHALNEWAAKLVYGKGYHIHQHTGEVWIYKTLWNPLGDMNQAMQVVEALTKDVQSFQVTRYTDPPHYSVAAVYGETRYSQTCCHLDEVPRAIVEAAYKAKEKNDGRMLGTPQGT